MLIQLFHHPEWEQKLENEVKFDLSIPKIVEKNPNGKQPIIDELFSKQPTRLRMMLMNTS